MDYSIRHVFDASSGEVYDARTVFMTIPKGQLFRKNYYINEPDLRCMECHQRATVSNNKLGHVHFKHFPNTGYCILKDDKLSIEERKQIEDHIASKEGKRHRSLKKSISVYLANQHGVDSSSITIDDHFLKDDRERRRPDISCRYFDRTLVFEIQISPLPAKYIYKRSDFYQRNQIYLIWILDDFDVSGQSQTEKDIKYLSKHENFFYFNDSSKSHTLVVQFKEGLVNSNRQVYSKWTHEPVSLSELTFDLDEHQVFFRSFADEIDKAETKRIELELTLVIELLREFFRTDDEKLISQIDAALADIGYDSWPVLNDKMGLSHGTDLFFKSLTSNGKPNFIFFIFKYSLFVKNLNTKNADGMNLLEHILLGNFTFRHRLIQLLFINKYILSESDKAYLCRTMIVEGAPYLREQYILRIFAYNTLRDYRLIEQYDRSEGPMLTILSAKHNRIIGMGFTNFLGLANNAIQHYKTLWPFIEQVFIQYGLWDNLMQSDKKGTFKKKLDEYNEIRDEIDNSGSSYELMIKLFPEIFQPEANSMEWIGDITELYPVRYDCTGNI